MIKTKFIVLGCALGCFFEQNAQFFYGLRSAVHTRMCIEVNRVQNLKKRR